MVLAQAGDGNSVELVLKLMAAALPVVGGGFALFQTLRRQPQTTKIPTISLVALSSDALDAPEVLEHKPERQSFIEKVSGSVAFQLVGGAAYTAFGVGEGEPAFWAIGGVIILVAVCRLLWRLALSTFGEVKSDRVEIVAVVAGDVEDVLDACVDAIQQLRGRIVAIDRDERTIESLSNRGASIEVRLETERQKRKEWWRRRADPGRYRLVIAVESLSPDAWTAGRHIRLAQKLVEKITGVRWRRAVPEEKGS